LCKTATTHLLNFFKLKQNYKKVMFKRFNALFLGKNLFFFLDIDFKINLIKLNAFFYWLCNFRLYCFKTKMHIRRYLNWFFKEIIRPKTSTRNMKNCQSIFLIWILVIFNQFHHISKNSLCNMKTSFCFFSSLLLFLLPSHPHFK